MKGKRWKLFARFGALLMSLLLISVTSSNASALSGKVDLTSARNNYVYIYSANQVSTWGTNDFGVPIYAGVQPINGITWTVDINQPQYGTYTNGYYEFTLQGYGNWVVDGGDLTNITCEVWSTGTPQSIASNAYISKGYYNVEGTNIYAVDYRCEFEATNKTPSYIYTRLGNATTSTTAVPIMYGYNQTGIRTQPFVRNVSFTYNTSNESLEAGQLGDLINGQKNIYDKADEINDTLQEQNDRDTQDREDMQNTSDNADASADSSQQQAEQTGTTLLAAFTSFVNAITTSSPTNCNLDMDLGNLDLGVVNLCQLSPPAGFSTLASIFLILFCVPLSIATARKVISLFRSFQG